MKLLGVTGLTAKNFFNGTIHSGLGSNPVFCTNFILVFSIVKSTSGQSFKCSTIVNHNSRAVMTRNLPSVQL